MALVGACEERMDDQTISVEETSGAILNGYTVRSETVELAKRDTWTGIDNGMLINNQLVLAAAHCPFSIPHFRCEVVSGRERQSYLLRAT